MNLRDAASKKMRLGEFLKENVCYCVYGEYTWNDCSVYDSQDSCHKISIPHFCDMKVVAVENGVESVFVDDESSVMDVLSHCVRTAHLWMES